MLTLYFLAASLFTYLPLKVCPIPECQYPQHLANFNSSDIDDNYSRLLLQRDCRLSRAAEEVLRDVILADPSDYGMDLAVAKIFASYQPGTQRWEQLQYPNACWLTCKIDATVNQPSQTVHVNLLDGDLRVAGKPLGDLLYYVWERFCDVRIRCSF